MYYQENNGPKNIIIPITQDDIKPTTVTFKETLLAVNDYPLLTIDVSNISDHHSTGILKNSYSVSSSIEVNSTSHRLKDTSYASAISSSMVEMQQLLSIDRSENILAAATLSIKEQSSTPEQTSTTPRAPTSSLNTSLQNQDDSLSDKTNEVLLISVTSAGSAVILVTLPVIVLIIVISVFVAKSKKQQFHYCADTSELPTTEVQLQRPRESMQVNPLYYYNLANHPMPRTVSGYLEPVSTLKKGKPNQMQQHNCKIQQHIYDEITPFHDRMN